MGFRTKLPDGTVGGYEWMTYSDVHTVYDELARGCKAMRLLEPIEGLNEDGRQWAFSGVWAPNSWKWYTTSLASMTLKSTIVGFYSSMNDEQVNFCLNQTRLETIFCTMKYFKRVLTMRENGLAGFVKNVVVFDADEEFANLKQGALQKDPMLHVHTFDEVREAGRGLGGKVCKLEPELVDRDDIYMLNFTSGTTGDSKGVKVSHWSLLCSIIV